MCTTFLCPHCSGRRVNSSFSTRRLDPLVEMENWGYSGRITCGKEDGVGVVREGRASACERVAGGPCTRSIFLVWIGWGERAIRGGWGVAVRNPSASSEDEREL